MRDVDWDERAGRRTTLEEYVWLRLRWFRHWRDDGHGDGSTAAVWYAVRVRLDATDAELRLLRCSHAPAWQPETQARHLGRRNRS